MWKHVWEYINHIIVAFAFAFIAAVIYERYHNNPHLINYLLYISILAIVAVFIAELFRQRKKKIKALKEYYTFTGKSPSLKQKEERDKVLGWRPFHSYYYPRQEDDQIEGSLKNKENVLIIGHPLSGKSRAVYEALTKLNKPQNVAIARHTDINLETFLFPKKTKIIFIDDLQRFVDVQNFEHLFTTARENKTVIVAACRSGEDYKKVTGIMLDKKNMPLETIFKNENIIELPEISKEVGRKIANEVRIPWDKVKSKFNHTVGSIFMDLKEMGNRFNNCDNEKKTVLRAIRSLYLCGIYEENLLFPLQWIKITAKKVGLEKNDFEWTGLLENLRDKAFILLEGDKVQAEEVYLESIVTPLIEGEILDVSEKTVTLFSGIPNALFELGDRAYTIGAIPLEEKEKQKYLEIAINAYTEALNVWTPKDFPTQSASAYNNRGNAYNNKGEYDRAIADYTRALEINPRNALVYDNRGNAYNNKGEYDRAISDYNEALKINQRYVGAYNNRGRVYGNKGEHDRAISDFNKALEINQRDALAYYNRGTAYGNKGEYDRAIADFNKAIEINPRYAEAYFNRGSAYNKKGEYERAFSDYNKALEINPGLTEAYYRVVAYLLQETYDKAWEDVDKAKGLGYQVHPGFLKALREALGKD